MMVPSVASDAGAPEVLSATVAAHVVSRPMATTAANLWRSFLNPG